MQKSGILQCLPRAGGTDLGAYRSIVRRLSAGELDGVKLCITWPGAAS